MGETLRLRVDKIGEQLRVRSGLISNRNALQSGERIKAVKRALHDHLVVDAIVPG